MNIIDAACRIDHEYKELQKECNDLKRKLDDERKRRKDAEALLYNYSSLANAAMFDANHNGYEYDRKGEMVDVRAHFARYKGE